MMNTDKDAVICFGEVLWDMLPGGPQPGGAPMNVGIHLKKQGLSPVVVSKTGNDKEGDRLKQFLEKEGLGTGMIETDPELPTSQVLVHLDADKNATYEICEPVAWDNILSNSEMEKMAEGAGLLVFGTLASRNAPTRNTLRQLLENTSAIRLLDVNLRPPYDHPGIVEPLLRLADFVKLNNEELAQIASWQGREGDESSLMHWLSDFYRCEDVCVTRGANGAALLTGGEFFEHNGFKVNAVDTVGAGDSFLAGLIAGLAAKRSPRESLEHACATGAFVASRKGAVPDYSEKDIEAIRRLGKGETT